MDLESRIREILDFPKPGIRFKDITTLLQDPQAFKQSLDEMQASVKGQKIDVVVGIESRGFIFGAPLADRLGVGFVPVRKLGKLPGATIHAEYSLEYGTNTIEMHRDSIQAGQRVMIVDDLLATGGTVGATAKLVEELGGEVAMLAFLIELKPLGGREKLQKYNITALIEY